MINETTVQADYADIRRARDELYRATEAEITAQHAYDDARHDCYLAGAVVGKNAEEREAKLFDLTRVELQALRTAQARRREMEMLYHQAQSFIEEDAMRINVAHLPGDREEPRPEPGTEQEPFSGEPMSVREHRDMELDQIPF